MLIFIIQQVKKVKLRDIIQFKVIYPIEAVSSKDKNKLFLK